MVHLVARILFILTVIWGFTNIGQLRDLSSSDGYFSLISWWQKWDEIWCSCPKSMIKSVGSYKLFFMTTLCTRHLVMNEVQIYELQVYWNVMRHHANSFEDTSMQFVSFLRWHTRTAFANLRWPTYMYVLLGRLDSGCCHSSPNIHTLKSCASVMDKGYTVCHTKWLRGVFIKKMYLCIILARCKPNSI